MTALALLASCLYVACYSEKTASRDAPPAAAGSTMLPPTAGAGGEVEPGPIEEEEELATLALFHASNEGPAASFTFTAGDIEQSGSFASGEVKSLQGITPGSYTLLVEIDAEEHEVDLELPAGAERVVVITRADGGGWRLDSLAPEIDPAAENARLFVLQHTAAPELELDVNSDGSSEGALASSAVSPQWALDVTRPALSLLQNQLISHQFALPRPTAKSTVVAVMLGDPNADGLDPDGLRLLVADMARAEVVEVRPNPQVYVVHASAAHAALDVFVSQGNPQWTPVQLAAGDRVGAYSPDLSENVRPSVAEVADNVRFGEVRVGRVPSGPVSLDLYLSIIGDPQLPAPLSVDLIFNPLPNQRLRNGGAVGRQSTSHLGDQLRAGARYLLVANGTDLWLDNRSPFAPAAPAFPLELLERPKLGPTQLALWVASSITKDGTVAGVSAAILRNGETMLDTSGDFQMSPVHLMEAGELVLTLSTATKSASLPIHGSPGQNLLVIAAGDVSPPPVVPQPQPRSDDIDGDGAVASVQDPVTGATLEPNYLAYDGNSSLVQDDCPTEPGSVSHGGCPSPGLTWIVIDLAQQPPQVVTATMN